MKENLGDFGKVKLFIKTVSEISLKANPGKFCAGTWLKFQQNLRIRRNVGNLKEKFWKDAADEYTKRLGKFCKVKVVELTEQNKYENPDKIVEIEGDDILSHIESILHTAVKNYIQNTLSQQTTQLVILSAPLLFETGLNCFCNNTICLYASKRTQRIRALQRPNMTREKFEILYRNQWNNQQRKQMCTLWVSTEIPETETYQTIIQFLKKQI